MNLKNEKCVLIYAPYNQKSSLIIKDLLESKLRIRIITDNLQGFKNEFFDVWERFDSVSQCQINYQNFIRQKEKFFDFRNNITPEYFLFLKTSNSKKYLYPHEIELINYLKAQKQIKKLIYVHINNKKSDLFNQYKYVTKDYNVIESDTNYSVENIYNFYLESKIRQSGINYLIVKNLEIEANSYVFGQDHTSFFNISDFILNNRLNLVNYKNFKELIQKVIDGKIFIDDSTYLVDKSSYDSIIKYSTPQFVIDYLNFMYKDFYLRKIVPESSLIKKDRFKIFESSKVYSLIGISFGIKLLTYSLRFFINTYR